MQSTWQCSRISEKSWDQLAVSQQIVINHTGLKLSKITIFFWMTWLNSILISIGKNFEKEIFSFMISRFMIKMMIYFRLRKETFLTSSCSASRQTKATTELCWAISSCRGCQEDLLEKIRLTTTSTMANLSLFEIKIVSKSGQKKVTDIRNDIRTHIFFLLKNIKRHLFIKLYTTTKIY